MVKGESVVNGAVNVGLISVGFIGSRVASDNIPGANTMVGNVIKVVGGIAVASMVDGKMKKLPEGVAIEGGVNLAGEVLSGVGA